MASHEKPRTFGQPLQSGQGLAPVALLDTDMDVILLRPNVVLSVERVSLVGEGVCTSGGHEGVSVNVVRGHR